MNAPTLVLLVCLTIIATLAILLYISVRNRLADCELHRALDQIRIDIRAIEKTAAKDRRVLNDAHKQISGVTKALQKQAR